MRLLAEQFAEYRIDFVAPRRVAHREVARRLGDIAQTGWEKSVQFFDNWGKEP